MYVKKMCFSGVGGVTFLLNYLFSHARDQLRPISTNQTKIHLKQMKTPD